MMLNKERTQIELEKFSDQIEELNKNPPIDNNLLISKNEEIELLNQKLNEIVEKYKYSEIEKGFILCFRYLN